MENEERLEIFKQQMTLWGKVINALDDVFGEDSWIEVADDPYNYLQFTVEQGKKRVTIKKVYEDGMIVVKVVITTIDDGYWESSIPFFPSYYDEYLENHSFETYLRELTRKFVENGILSWRKEND